jgi:hypothetical protein
MQRNAVLAGLFVLSLAACTKEEPVTDTTLTADAATATHPASPGGTAIVPSTEAGTTVAITLADGRIAVQGADSIPPGPAVLTVNNSGPGVHSVFVEGPGVSKAPDTSTIAAGGMTSFDVTFQPGSYTLYCPVQQHRDAGEAVTLVIKPAGAPAPTSTVVPATPTTST